MVIKSTIMIAIKLTQCSSMYEPRGDGLKIEFKEPNLQSYHDQIEFNRNNI